MIDNKKCALNCVIIVLLVSLLFIFIIIIIVSIAIKRIREAVKRTYMTSIVDSCSQPTQLQYTVPLRIPSDLTLYNYDTSKALLEVSLYVTHSNCKNIVPIPNPPGFTYQYRVIGNHPSDDSNRMVATIFTNFAKDSNTKGKFLMVFTGTFFKNEWGTDFNFPLTPATDLNNYKPGVELHRGFYNFYLTIRYKLWSIYNSLANNIVELYITGHSLGGALSTIAAFDFSQYNPIHYSFASPRVGNIVFADTFNSLVPNSMRVYNIDDQVPQLPPPVAPGNNYYQHVKNNVAFDINLGGIGRNHIQAYQYYLPKCVKDIAPCN